MLSALVLGATLFIGAPVSAAISSNTGSVIVMPASPGAPLTTTVTDLNGSPLMGAQVTVYKDAGYTQIADDQVVAGSTTDATAKTDAQGKVAFTIPAGSYYLYTSYDMGLAGKVTSVVNITATSGVALQKNIQLVFVGNNATITVTDVLNNPLAGAVIKVYKDAGQTQIADNLLSNASQTDATGTTDAQGNVHIQLASGTYYVSSQYTVPANQGIVTSIGNWTVTSGVQNTRVFQLVSVGINTNITLTDINGGPVKDAMVTIYKDAANTQIADDYNSNISLSDATGKTDGQGAIRFNLPSGTYYVYTKYDFGLAGTTTSVTNFTVNDDVLNQKAIQLKLVGANAIIQVTDLNGAPLPGASVTIFKDTTQTQVADNIASNTSSADASGITDAQGKTSFTIHGGTYSVLVTYGATGSSIAKSQTVAFVDGVITNTVIAVPSTPCAPGVTLRCIPPPPTTVTVEPCVPTTTHPCTPTTTTEQPCVPTTTHPCTPPPPTTTENPCPTILNALIPCEPTTTTTDEPCVPTTAHPCTPPPPPTGENPCGLTLNALIPCEPETTGTETTVSRVYSLVTVDPKAVLADGVSTALVSVTLRDGTNKPVIGKTVAISTPLPGTTFSAASGTTDTTGRVTFTLKGTQPGVALIKATADSVALNTVAVEFSKPGQCPFVAGSLFKLTDDGNKETQADNAVYYYGTDCKRHAFPNERIFGGWYQDFRGITIVSPETMAKMNLGKNVVYRPAARMVKFATLNKVYVVGKGGALRWVTSEAVAKGLYGDDWNKKIDDISDAFFTNYNFGTDVATTTDYDPAAEQESAPSISMNF
jgi:uncharacterized GH25 family protein